MRCHEWRYFRIIQIAQISRHSQVEIVAIAPRDSTVGDFSHDTLHPAVLASLRRTRISNQLEDFLPNQVAQSPIDLVDLLIPETGKALNGEGLTEDRCIPCDLAIIRCEPVESRSYNRMDRTRNLELVQIAYHFDTSVTHHEAPVRQQHTDHLNGKQRHTAGGGDDPIHNIKWNTRYGTNDEFLHLLVGQRTHIRRREPAPTRAPVRSAV